MSQLHIKIINEMTQEVWLKNELVATFYGEHAGFLANFLVVEFNKLSKAWAYYAK